MTKYLSLKATSHKYETCSPKRTIIKDQELIFLYFLLPNICGEIFKFCNIILNLLIMFLLIIDSQTLVHCVIAKKKIGFIINM